jgi:hypothetical protein
MNSCDQFCLEEYNISIRLLETIIYFKIINNITYQCFEDNINICDIKLNFNNKNIYSIISKCFNNKDKNYKVIFTIEKDIMNLSVDKELFSREHSSKENILNLNFIVIFDNEFDINFNLIIKELSLNFHRMNEENNNKVRILEDRIVKLEDIINSLVNVEHIMYTTNPNSGATNYCNSLKLNLSELIIGDSSYSMDMLNKIEYFYQLNKLTLGGSYNHSTIEFSNKTLQKLVIKTNYLTSLKNLDKLPSLEKIEIHSSELKNIIPYLHKNIKNIIFFNGAGISTKEKLIPYCKKNNIEIMYI